MKALAKYLPVEGKPELGDIYIDNNGTLGLDGLSEALLDKGYKRAKFFAVTKDIEVGDEVYDTQLQLWGKLNFLSKANSQVVFKDYDYSDNSAYEYHNIKPERLFKVLGELSPNATWVENGDEIEIELVPRGVLKPDGEPLKTDYGTSQSMKTVTEVQVDVKCPTCNTFH